MNITLSFSEIEEILNSVRASAHEANRTANSAITEGYPPSVEAELSSKSAKLYLLAEKIENQRREFGAKAIGSTGTVDPYENVLEEEKTHPPRGSSKYDSPKSPNDPIEW